MVRHRSGVRDMDMLLSASPPNFTVGLNNYYSSPLKMRMFEYPVSPGKGGRGPLAVVPNRVHPSFADYATPGSPKPKRSILVLRHHSLEDDDDDEEPNINTVEMSRAVSDDAFERRNKRVCFADDKGLALAHVKIMHELSSQPPTIGDDVLATIAAKGAIAKAESDNIWEVSFTQPASDYLKFRQFVESNNVALENVVIKDYQVFGTVKVRNLAFEKEVFVRITFNNWTACVDVPAQYVPSGLNGSSSLFDTFSFDLNIPPETDTKTTIQFCVCLRLPVEGKEFWDSAGGQNYRLSPVKVDEDFGAPFLTTIPNPAGGEEEEVAKYFEPYPDLNGGAFASWKNIDDSLPYW